MENVVTIKVSRTENGYSAACDLIEGWVVALTGNFDTLEKEVKESIDTYIEWAKEDGDSYNSIFDTDYELQYEIL